MTLETYPGVQFLRVIIFRSTLLNRDIEVHGSLQLAERSPRTRQIEFQENIAFKIALR